ncbi:MAG: ParB N-terminal domain-containing protein [Fimbriiglobus sp.]
MSTIPRVRFKIEYLPVDMLRPHPDNPRSHPERQVEVMEEILDKYGITDCLCGWRKPGFEEVELIDGHMRLELFRQMYGSNPVPVRVLDVESEEEARELLAVTDQVGGMAMIMEQDWRGLIGSLDIPEGGIAAMLSMVDTVKTEKEDKAPAKPKAKYPIAPVFSESYDYAVIMCRTVIEFAWLQTFLKMKRQKSYKNSNIGHGRAIFCKDLIALVEQMKTDVTAGNDVSIDMTDVNARAAEMEEMAAGGNPEEVPPPGEQVEE